MESSKWPDLCEQLIATIDQAQRDKSLNGEELVLLLTEHFGGQILYLPKAVSFRSFVRDQQIYTDFNGSNHKELCIKYDLTEPRIYQIIAEQRKLRQQRNQGTLDLV